MLLTKINSNKVKTGLIILNVSIFAFFTFLLIKTISQDLYYPVNDDEHVYINSARMFAENNSVIAPTSIEGKKSIIAETHWYGPMFHIVYGSIFKLFGASKYVFLCSNYFFLILALSLIYLFRIKLETKLLFCFLLITTYSAFPFVFTFFPEPIIVVLTMLNLLFFERITNQKELLLFAAVLMLSTLFRVTFSFLCIFVLFLDSEKIKIKKPLKILTASVLFVWGIFVYKTLCAPPAVKALSTLIGGDKNISNIIFHTALNNIKILYNFLFFTPFGSITLISFPLYCILIISSIKREEYTTFSRTMVIACVSFAVLVFTFFYTFDIFFLEKQLIIFHIILLYLVLYLNANRKHIILVHLIIIFPFTYSKTLQAIKDRIAANVKANSELVQIKSLKSCINDVETENRNDMIIFLDINSACCSRNTMLGNLIFKKHNTCLSFITSNETLCDGNIMLLLRTKEKADYAITSNSIREKDSVCSLIGKHECFNLYKVK